MAISANDWGQAMISLDNAKRLRELGLKWKLQKGDFYKYDYEYIPGILVWDGVHEHLNKPNINGEDIIWLPTLSQLLEEVEKREHVWDLGGRWDSVYWCSVYGHNPTENIRNIKADTPEDAVALALISILESVAK